MIYFNFCQPVKTTLCGEGVAACYIPDPSTSNAYSLGNFSTLSYRIDDLSGSIEALFNGGTEGRSLVVILECTAFGATVSFIKTQQSHWIFYDFSENFLVIDI